MPFSIRCPTVLLFCVEEDWGGGGGRLRVATVPARYGWWQMPRIMGVKKAKECDSSRRGSFSARFGSERDGRRLVDGSWVTVGVDWSALVEQPVRQILSRSNNCLH